VILSPIARLVAVVNSNLTALPVAPAARLVLAMVMVTSVIVPPKAPEVTPVDAASELVDTTISELPEVRDPIVIPLMVTACAPDGRVPFTVRTSELTPVDVLRAIVG